MHWLITGAGGLLGWDVARALEGREVTSVTRAVLDITDASAVMDAVTGHDVVVNCAGWTGVDEAETRESEAFAVNALGPALLARACARSGALLVQPSTDYVFSGTARSPYPEDTPPAPRSVYGRSKLAGEWAVRAESPDRHLIVRTAWLYGAHGRSFVRTMARLERELEHVEVVDDQRGQPTWSRDLAGWLVALVDAGAPAGTYQATSSGSTTWFGLARRLFELIGADPERVRPTTSDRFVRPASRPAYSVLGHGAWEAAGLPLLRSWESALREAVASGEATGEPAGTGAVVAGGHR